MNVKYGMHSIEGKGSRFWMRFTQYSGDVKAVDPLPAGDNIATPVRYAPLHGSCLIVDDDPLVTSAWESLMSLWGINVRCAASAEDALPSLTTVSRHLLCCATSACAPAKAGSTS